MKNGNFGMNLAVFSTENRIFGLKLSFAGFLFVRF